jgi:aryl-alcohol dehydrogenase-like predicted oxidoreductase
MILHLAENGDIVFFCSVMKGIPMISFVERKICDRFISIVSSGNLLTYDEEQEMMDIVKKNGFSLVFGDMASMEILSGAIQSMINICNPNNHRPPAPQQVTVH